ncbi:hypothetical protein [Rhodoferax sp.]|uniref:hypothetical protein n=1 Tax=Rhodoferax sp. TaxID=50421 RepID=UPI0027185277|nr:hypothetical protein [Rhodoferax sp.]MDO9145466.1 hypothetical protein [Rhodoferax sp.]MDP1530898.1 hypothetical protein [Rhodoferax sp.]MDP2440271.1 hypothetical protein [Rhodoferax sp.]MDP3191789.1 hypothetical protein [Rhodoferax sp.]MDP3863233.1 hypothetical protein [Rhodoferax sp.]
MQSHEHRAARFYSRGPQIKIESVFLRHDYNPRESPFYENLQKICFGLYQPGGVLPVGGALVIGAVVAMGLIRWQGRGAAL